MAECPIVIRSFIDMFDITKRNTFSDCWSRLRAATILHFVELSFEVIFIIYY